MDEETRERIAALERAVAELNVLAGVAVNLLDRTNAYHSGLLLEWVTQLAAEHPERVDFADAVQTVRELLTLPPDQPGPNARPPHE